MDIGHIIPDLQVEISHRLPEDADAGAKRVLLSDKNLLGIFDALNSLGYEIIKKHEGLSPRAQDEFAEVLREYVGDDAALRIPSAAVIADLMYKGWQIAAPE